MRESSSVGLCWRLSNFCLHTFATYVNSVQTIEIQVHFRGIPICTKEATQKHRRAASKQPGAARSFSKSGSGRVS